VKRVSGAPRVRWVKQEHRVPKAHRVPRVQ
jgi:hypothetical protein